MGLEQNLISEFSRFIKKDLDIIVILALGRSASLFVEGLLDSDEIIVNRPISLMPNNLNIFHAQKNKLTQKEMDSFRAYLYRNISRREFESCDIFMDMFDYIIENTTEKIDGLNAFKLFYFIFIQIRKIDIDKVKYILAHQHMIDITGDNSEDFYKNFKNHYFIFPVKNTKIQMQSLFRHIHSNLDDNIHFIYCHLYMTSMAYNFYKKNKDKSYILYNENLNQQPQETIQKLLGFLNINYDEQIYLKAT
ncbi:MAG: hypothetical protein JXQ66_03600, partial [Campylobacterales bacterium]|nr:hypothetical protein [Campylobacterales bacterium]